MMLVPFAAILGSGLVGIWLAQNISPVLNTVGAFIKDSSAGSPFIASIVIAVVWGLLLISPASSAALAIALSLDGVAEVQHLQDVLLSLSDSLLFQRKRII